MNPSLLPCQAVGLDSAQAGNVVQITLVLGLMLAWTATYVFRVGNKEMTYVKQLKDYEDAVMQVRMMPGGTILKNDKHVVEGGVMEQKDGVM